MKTRIYIGTPNGPVQVERIWREDGIAESMVCLKRSTEKLPIGAGYDDFVKRPSGIIEREFGPFEASAFRLDLSARITQGKSWQLAVFAAHALARDGLLAGPDDPFERAIWLTGEVDNDLKVGAVTQVPEKIHGALGELEALAKAGKQTLLYVPQENAEALASANIPPGIEARAVASAADLLDAIGMPMKRRAAPPPQTAKPTKRPPDRHRRKRAVLGLAFVVLGAAAVAAGIILPGELMPDAPPATGVAVQETSAPDEPEPEAKAEEEPAPADEPAPAAIEAEPIIAIFEVHPSAAGGCPAVHFGASSGVLAEIEPTSAGNYMSNTATDLCAIEFKLTPAPGHPYMALAIEEISGSYVEIDPMPAALKGGEPLSGPLTWRINLPLGTGRQFEYELHVVSSERAVAAEVYKSLKIGDITTANQSGMSITTARHAVLR
ncbi:MAG: hypothetical protein QF666_12630 [Alphaproteobacteria bacterium]|nr:hypothetical protein [Alphaproteobacteria bacterium]